MSAGEDWIMQTLEKIPVVGYAIAATGQGTLAMRAALSCTDSTATALLGGPIVLFLYLGWNIYFFHYF